ncbi:MAG: 50S ribosomal protein L22 [bacterium]
MQAIARTRFTRISSRKVGRVLDLIRGKYVDEAFRILQFVPKAAAPIVQKTLHSAVANSGRLKNPAGLKVKQAWVGHGPALKRIRAFAMGRAFGYKRKMCHITVVVGDN